jgi:hypothetical protein
MDRGDAQGDPPASELEVEIKHLHDLDLTGLTALGIPPQGGCSMALRSR